MASDGPDEPCNSETEPETIALRIKQKRSRRVSFAGTEITSKISDYRNLRPFSSHLPNLPSFTFFSFHTIFQSN
ncbi:hypothetical protein ACFX12_038838 [Malus domestica]